MARQALRVAPSDGRRQHTERYLRPDLILINDLGRAGAASGGQELADKHKH